jgi:hypothetical protein
VLQPVRHDPAAPQPQRSTPRPGAVFWATWPPRNRAQCRFPGQRRNQLARCAAVGAVAPWWVPARAPEMTPRRGRWIWPVTGEPRTVNTTSRYSDQHCHRCPGRSARSGPGADQSGVFTGAAGLWQKLSTVLPPQPARSDGRCRQHGDARLAFQRGQQIRAVGESLSAGGF